MAKESLVITELLSISTPPLRTTPMLNQSNTQIKKEKRCNRRDCSADINNSITYEKGSKAVGVPINE